MHPFNTMHVPIRTAMILTMITAATFDVLGAEIPGPEGLRREDIKPGRYWQFYRDGSSKRDKEEPSSDRDPNDFTGTRTLTVLEEKPADQTILLLQEDFDGKQSFYSAGWLHPDKSVTQIANTSIEADMLFPPTSGTTTPLIFFNLAYPETPMKQSVSTESGRTVITQSLENAKIPYKLPPEYAVLNAPLKSALLQTQISAHSIGATYKLHRNTVVPYETQFIGSLSFLATDATQPKLWEVKTKLNLIATGVWDKAKTDAMIHEVKYVEKMKIQPTWAERDPVTFCEKCDLFEIERNSREYYETFPNPMFQETIKKYTRGKITVTDPDGKGISGVMIGMMPENSRYLKLSFQGTTDAHGTFFPLDDFRKNSPKDKAQGAWVLAAAPGYPLISQLIPDPQKDTTITLEKNDDAFPLDIRITDSAGKPVDNAQVALVPVDDNIASCVYPFLPEKMSGILPFTYGAPEKLSTPGCWRYIINPYGSLPKRQTGGFSGLFQAMKHANMKAHVIVNQPGVIANVMTSQPITLAKQNAPFEVRLPKPTPLTLHITPPPDSPKDVKYRICFTQPLSQVPGLVLTSRSCYLPSKSDFVSLPLETSTTLLPPGDHSLTIDASNVYSVAQADDLSTQIPFVLKEGVPLNLKIRMQRCTPAEYAGNQTLKLKIGKGTQPAAGMDFVLQAMRTPEKFIAVTSGTLDANGEAVIPNLRGDDDFDLPTYRLAFPGNKRSEPIEVPMPEDQPVVTFELTIPPPLMTPAPDFQAIDVKTGKTVHLSDLRGKWVFLDFWATWCGPCQKPMEENQKLSLEMPEIQQGKLLIVGLSIDENQKTVKSYIENKGWTAPLQWWAENGAFDSAPAKAYGIGGVPRSFMIDPEGVLRWKGHPASFNIKEFMETEAKQ